MAEFDHNANVGPILPMRPIMHIIPGGVSEYMRRMAERYASAPPEEKAKMDADADEFLKEIGADRWR
jgi:hypothetical protein